MNVFIRYPSEGIYYARWLGPDPARPGRQKQYLRSTGERDARRARVVLRQLAAASRAGRWDALTASKMRGAAPVVTLGQVIDAYPAAAAAQRLKHRTAAENVNAMLRILRAVCRPEQDVRALPVTALTGHLVYSWKERVLAGTEKADEMAAQRACRSANSTLRQARGVFSAQVMAHYQRVAQLAIPDSIHGFLTEPGFARVEKQDYNKPGDLVLARTFEALPGLAASDSNLFRAVWLALGFGLRKSEIAEVRAGWFLHRDGIWFLRAGLLGKNRMVPDIRGQFGVEKALGSIIKALDPQDYVLPGPVSERKVYVFRRCGAWMRKLGWQTQKTIHEFRAYAGCKVAEAEGLLAAQKWLRHASYAVTEKNYGRYVDLAAAAEVTLPVTSRAGAVK